MNLHEDKELFRQAVAATAQQMQIPEIYVEKDYWVTLALKFIFASEVAGDTVFKGGTALSKCHKLIARFSEDVDIVIIRREGENGNQLKNKLKAVSTSIESVMPEIDLPGITNKKGMIRKTAHGYAKSGFEGVYGQVREYIVLESTWLGRSEPYTVKPVSSYIGDMMLRTSQSALAEKYGMLPFDVQVLSIERTFCEKVMSLVRFSFTEHPYEDLANKIRHTYDLHLMLQDGSIQGFFKSKGFEQMLNTVGQDDVASFKNNNQWLANHPATAIIFNDTENTWAQIRQAYHSSFRDLVIGELPEEQAIISTLKMIGDRLKTVEWGVQPS
ncbi:nucleotidyl transferase AbiEii/AbiGii toxin family protein [Sediminibacterium ginsengisoli]|uniref:Nucleotidyl transferase AbiEii toxin, Type IV TA system n=1 Tax=Sediminibacterium ginsengisoli TaxID=413434 RepID=A0A1T4P1P9_9BACT|nr:nucleotidyl transferase AbiEii/AbiGii toxin family protein [Sediminibacterium ginsengisoli]SJZ84868.1 Nucleotidyl transferase AbiEii toxin, Type IV TA system [Sediminibacterium ginsengisoli]